MFAISNVFECALVPKQKTFVAIRVEGVAIRVLGAKRLALVLVAYSSVGYGMELAIGVAAGAFCFRPRVCKHARKFLHLTRVRKGKRVFPRSPW